jgi:hypothetical protein
MISFLPKNNKGGEWRTVAELKVGQSIAVPKEGVIDAHKSGQIEPREWIGDGDVLWDEIESIEYVGTEQVWDIEVEGTHNFVGNNIFAHNTYLSGNLGVATSTPFAQLGIGGSAVGSTLFGLDALSGQTAPIVDIKLASTSKFIIDNIGNIGVGTTSPSARLSVTQSANTSAGGIWIAETGNTDFRSVYMDTSGVMSFYGGDMAGTLNTATLNAAGEWTNASDLAYKDDVQDMVYGLQEVMQLTPRTYKIKNTNDLRVGFIAQEIELVIPEVVSGQEGSKGISYGNLVAVVVRAVQELNKKLDDAIVRMEAVTVKFDELAAKMGDVLAWFKGGNFVVQNNICVDDTCVTKDQFRELLLKSGVGAVQIVSQQTDGSESGSEADSEVADSSSAGTSDSGETQSANGGGSTEGGAGSDLGSGTGSNSGTGSDSGSGSETAADGTTESGNGTNTNTNTNTGTDDATAATSDTASTNGGANATDAGTLENSSETSGTGANNGQNLTQ